MIEPHYLRVSRQVLLSNALLMPDLIVHGALLA